MIKREPYFLGLAAVSALIFFRILWAYLIPITQDEAYYLAWGKYLDWGYYDHPPFVAFIGKTADLGQSSAFFARLGPLLVAIALLPVMVSLAKKCGMKNTAAVILAVILSNCSLAGLVFGTFTTPDAVLVLAWALTLNEVLAANSGKPYRWLSAGVFFGLGILSKYVMLLMGPVVLFGLLFGRREQLKTPWPYLGFFVTVLVCAPHLFWNYQNDWITFKFQLGRGFLNDYTVETSKINDLPRPSPPPEVSVERQLSQMLIDPFEEKLPKREKTGVIAMVKRIRDFLGAQIILWGIFIFPIGYYFYRILRRKEKSEGLEFKPGVIPLLISAAVVPIAVFALVALKAKVEANWAAVYMISASILLAPLLLHFKRAIYVGALVNILLVTLSAAYAGRELNFHGSKPHRDRLLKETYGFRDLSDFAATKLDGPIFTENYQITSMLLFYRPELKISQWPGLARKSEFNWKKDWQAYRLKDIEEARHFWVISNNVLPQRIEGFQPTAMSELRDCLDRGLIETKAQAGGYQHPCRNLSVHKWYLIRYEPVAF